MPTSFFAKTFICLTAIIVVALAASLVPADDVYMNNGKRYQGRATTQGDKVIIEMEQGTIIVNQSDVLTIEKADLPQPQTKPSSPLLARPSTDAGTFKTVAGEMQMPESYDFMYMRNIASGSGAGTDNHKMAQKWQAMAHDRMRRDGTQREWAAPTEFDRRRQAFMKLLNDATESAKQAARTMLSLATTNESEKSKEITRKAKMIKANEQFLQAAQEWTDPLLRRFLMGVASSNAGDFEAAHEDFHKCCVEAPRVAAFHQGYAVALLGLDRQLDAMDQCLQVLRLEPDSADALSALRKAMAAVKGGQTTTEIYLQAAKAMRDYSEPAAGPVNLAAKTINWALPGKPVSAKEGSLPVPTYDRMVFRQAIAVPVAPHVLLVDRQLVDRSLDQDALDVFVRIDDKTIVRGKFSKLAGGTMAAKADSPFAAVTVPDCTFTPVTIDDKLALAAGQSVTVHGLSIFEEMGAKPRAFSAQAKAADDGDAPGALNLSEWLAPGEAAGPIFLSGTGLVGFVAGKTDVTLDFGGPDKIIPIADVAAAAKKCKSAGSSSGFSGASHAGRKITPTVATGDTFIVYATAGEVIK